MLGPWSWKPIHLPTGHSGPAVYAVRLLSRGKVFPVPRFLAVDAEGILTIGESENLESRRRKMCRAFLKGRGHSAMNLIFYLTNVRAVAERFARIAPEPSYQFAFIPKPDKLTACRCESELTRDYLNMYGEPPPLVSKIPDRYAHLCVSPEVEDDPK